MRHLFGVRLVQLFYFSREKLDVRFLLTMQVDRIEPLDFLKGLLPHRRLSPPMCGGSRAPPSVRINLTRRSILSFLESIEIVARDTIKEEFFDAI